MGAILVPPSDVLVSMSRISRLGTRMLGHPSQYRQYTCRLRSSLFRVAGARKNSSATSCVLRIATVSCLVVHIPGAQCTQSLTVISKDTGGLVDSVTSSHVVTTSRKGRSRGKTGGPLFSLARWGPTLGKSERSISEKGSRLDPRSTSRQDMSLDSIILSSSPNDVVSKHTSKSANRNTRNMNSQASSSGGAGGTSQSSTAYNQTSNFGILTLRHPMQVSIFCPIHSQTNEIKQDAEACDCMSHQYNPRPIPSHPYPTSPSQVNGDALAKRFNEKFGTKTPICFGRLTKLREWQERQGDTAADGLIRTFICEKYSLSLHEDTTGMLRSGRKGHMSSVEDDLRMLTEGTLGVQYRVGLSVFC